jgi:hypothetical protein
MAMATEPYRSRLLLADMGDIPCFGVTDGIYIAYDVYI